MTVDAVFFDLDGTLLDTAPDLARALNRLLEEEGREPIPEPVVRKVVSNGAYAMLKLAFGVGRDHPDTPELRQRLLDFYAEDLDSGTTLFPGLGELLERLTERDIAWGIVTNKPEPYAAPLVENFSFPSRPACVICPENVTHRKPHAESLHLACDYAKVKNDAAIYVGDHLRDIQCGQNAGMPTIAVNYGYIDSGDNAYDWGANYVVETGHEIWPIIEGKLSGRL